MKAKASVRRLLEVSPVILLVITYALPLLMVFVQDTFGAASKPSAVLVYPAVIVIWFFPPLAIGLSVWHLAKRRRIGESLVALLLTLPMVLVWVGSARRAMAEHQVQQDAPADFFASRHLLGSLKFTRGKNAAELGRWTSHTGVR